MMRSARLFTLLLLAAAGCNGTGKDTADTGPGIVDADGDGVPAGEDCDDEDASSYPGATEICDGADNDCDGDVDENVTGTWYTDADGDGYGDPDEPVEGCEGDTGLVDDDTDCDDTDADVNPGASETCNGEDDNCNDAVDEGLETGPWYEDADGDGYGDSETAEETCDPDEGWVEEGEDCDDDDATAYPDAEEVCDGVDNDCDDAVDEASATDAATWYEDADGDGYGNADEETTACDQPSGYVDDDTDCDDEDADVNPGATEVCDDDDTDEDCSGTADDEDSGVDVDSMLSWYPDTDGDGYGDAEATATVQCDAASGSVDDNTDCDDSTALVYPTADEYCDDVDNDCDGDVDEDAVDATTWYRDADGDGYGVWSDQVDACDQPSGYAADLGDCDDTDASMSPEGGCEWDTADTGIDYDYSGTYTGTGTVDITATSMMGTFTDSCTTTVDATVDETASPQITASATCTFSGSMAILGTVTGDLEGDITTDPDVEGDVAVSSSVFGVMGTTTWEGTFTDAYTLEGEFSGTETVMSLYEVTYDWTFTVTR